MAAAAAGLAMLAGCGHPVSSAASASALESAIAHASCVSPAPLSAAIGGQNRTSPAPGDASPVPITDGSYPAADVRTFFSPGISGRVVLRLPQPDAASASGTRRAVVLEVVISSANGGFPYSANDFSLESTDGQWYAGVPARVLDPTAHQSLSEGVVPARQMVDGFVAFDPPDRATTLKFVGVGQPCNPTVTWQLGSQP